MKLRSGKGLLLLLVMVLLATSVGCPNSTVIGAGNGAVELAIFSINQGRWLFDGPLDQARLTINRIHIRPTDMAADDLLGNNSLLTLTPSPIFVNLHAPQVSPTFILQIIGLTGLSQGTYEIVELQLSGIKLQDETHDPSTCESNLNFYLLSAVTITNFPTPLTFTVTRDQDVMVSLTFDVSAMVVAMNDASTCIPCTAAFCAPGTIDPAQFGALYATYLTLD